MTPKAPSLLARQGRATFLHLLHTPNIIDKKNNLPHFILRNFDKLTLLENLFEDWTVPKKLIVEMSLCANPDGAEL
jgi:hypothetical protein